MKKTLLFIVIVLFFSCKKENDSEFAIIGNIKSGNKPVENALVSIDNSESIQTTTDNNGYFKISNPPTGTHTINVYKKYSDGSEVLKNQSIEINGAKDLSDFIIPIPVRLDTLKITSELTTVKIKLAWTKTDAVDFYEYKVYRHISSGLDETTGTLVHVSTNANDTVFTDSIPHNSNYYYRVFVKNLYDKLGGSNIFNITTGSYKNILHLSLSQLNVGSLSKNETLWFYFDANKGDFYKVAWYDGWFNYTAGSIYVTGYKENKTDIYFERIRLIQMMVSPKAIFASNSEKVYLKIEGYDSNVEGTFGLKIDKLNKVASTDIPIDNNITTKISAGEVKLLSANLQKDFSYTVSMSADGNIGAYGDNVYVAISAYVENNYQPYFLDEAPNVIEWSGNPKNKIITALDNDKLYLVVTGAYWWNPRTVSIGITKN